MRPDDEYEKEFDHRPREPFDCGEVRVAATTDRALLVIGNGPLAEPTWIPRSQIESISEIDANDAEVDEEGLLYISAWLAEQRGWL